MKKIVVNSAYGMHEISVDALYLLMRLGFPLSTSPMEELRVMSEDFSIEGPDGFAVHRYLSLLSKDGLVYWFPYADHSLRSHPVLVKVFELLGKKFNGSCGRYEIVEVADEALYRIKEYDGAEGVEVYRPENFTAGHVCREIPVPEDLVLPNLVQLQGPVEFK
jgi:hypothetical protein